MSYCENEFCVYWEEQYCSLSEISLDEQGRCTDCLYVSIDKNYLREKRKESKKRQEQETP